MLLNAARWEATRTLNQMDLTHPLTQASAVQVLSYTDLLHGIFIFIDLEPNLCLEILLECVTVCRTFCESAFPSLE